MPGTLPTPYQARSAYARAVARSAPPDELADTQRDLATANIAKAIETHVAKAPPLTNAQKAALSALLGGGDHS